MESASSSTSGAQKQKRVLPSRSRRGGPGVGTCEVDILILETLKRRSENEPLIPASTSFILTTNSKYASDERGGAITVNMVANDRYFDRPEVIKAFREQVIIQTPEFSSIGESSNVGGRFRPRAAEDDGAETSDTTYEKRHRKFETFEKRQRLREKEKLKHEHYKMKERLDQLRAMDSAAFMALPASSFSSIPKETAVDPEEDAVASSPYTNMNGYLPHAEGERRRKQMLDIATMLEERYRVLLPPDRVRRTQELALTESASRSQMQSRDGEDSETDLASVVGEKLRLRLPARSSTSTTPAPSPAAIKPMIKKPRPSGSSKQSIRIVQPAAPTLSPPPSLPRTEASPLSPSPIIDMEISSPESTPPPFPMPIVATVLPHTHISNQDHMIGPGRPAVPLPNGAAKTSGIMSRQQNIVFPEQKRPFVSLEQEIPVTPPDQEMPVTPPDQEMPVTPPDQAMLISPIEQQRSPVPSDQEQGRPMSDPERSPILRNQERPIHDQDMVPTPLEQEREELSTPEPQRRPASPKPGDLITRDQEKLPTPPVPDRLHTHLEREKSITPMHRRSLTPLMQDKPVAPDQEKLTPPVEREKSVASERLPTPRELERTTTPTPEPESLPTPERLTIPPVDVADQDLQDSLPEKEPSGRRSIEPRIADDGGSDEVETEETKSVRAGFEVPAPQNESEKEVVEVEAEKMDVEQDGIARLVPVVAVTEQAAIADATMDVIPDTTEQMVLPDVPMPQTSADSGPTVTEEADVGLKIGRPVTPEQRPRTESVDIEGRMSSPMPISSISAPRGRGRKKAKLDASIQPNETVSAPARAPRVPKNHVTYIGASGEIEVTASAIMKAAMHRTQRDVTRHLNAFGVPVPNAIIQLGPPFELPEWAFPPLSPAESEHEYGDFDAMEDLQLDPGGPSDYRLTPPAQAGATEADSRESTVAAD